jgi:hypothetical protein
VSEIVGPTPWEIKWELRFLDGDVRRGVSYRHAHDTKDGVINYILCAHRYGWDAFSSFKDEALATSQLLLISVERATMPCPAARMPLPDAPK